MTPAFGDRLRGGATLLLLSCAAACFCIPLTNPDLFWHLSSARWMMEHGALPRADWLSFTMEGRSWSDFEWLIQLAWHAVFQAGSMAGLWTLKVALFSACASLLWSILSLYGVPNLGRAAAVFAWALGTVTANDLRPENASAFFFLLLWWGLEAGRLERLPKALNGPRLFAAAGLVFVLWANIHAGFVYGLGLIGIFAGAEIITRRSGRLLGLAALCAACALLNPYGVGIYRVLWEHWGMLDALSSHIREWQEASVLSPWLWPFWGILLLAYGAVLLRHLRLKDAPIEHTAALLLLSLSASGHIRTTIYFLCAALPLSADALMRLSQTPRARFWRAALLGLLCALGLAFFSWRVLPIFRDFRFFLPRYVPEQLTLFLKEEKPLLAGRRMLNPWHWGGYLGYELYPDMRVFVDGRYIFHPLLAPMKDALVDPGAYRAFLSEHGIEVAVLERTRQLRLFPALLKDGKRADVWRPFYLEFLPKADWALAYWDEQGLVFLKRSAFPRKDLDRLEFTAFRPDDLEAAGLLFKEGHIPRARLEAEVRRYQRLAGPLAAAQEADAWLSSLRRS